MKELGAVVMSAWKGEGGFLYVRTVICFSVIGITSVWIVDMGYVPVH